ncbi:MAG: prepilin-type N-terminal cleavage/methylation domain-containing protein [Deltaproteobacteria bacterium]|nr:prepilin-type N-terminal cleavage/methylation domain-containing protein [Deltaproteobacteria bacterium]
MGKRGFTLVEVLVALVVLAVGLLALTKLNLVYVRATALSHKGSEGALLAQDKMEELRRCAVADKPGSFAVYGFPYLISDAPGHTSIEDPPGSGTNVTIAGLLSGANGGAARTTSGGTTYEVLYDDGSHGDAVAGDGVYTGTDYVELGTQVRKQSAGTGHEVHRVYSVRRIPITVNGQTSTDYALLTVEASWVDAQSTPPTTRTAHLESLAFRRQ